MMEGEDEMGSQFDQQQAQRKRAGAVFPVFSALVGKISGAVE